jgi:hypothetical protein
MKMGAHAAPGEGRVSLPLLILASIPWVCRSLPDQPRTQHFLLLSGVRMHPD